MKSAKPPVADASSQRRSQPVRQTRANPPRSSTNAGRSGAGAGAGGRESLSGGAMADQPIDIFPAITHFTDTITALPKELVRHFTLLKEVEAKIFAPEDQLFKLVAAAQGLPLPETTQPNDDAPSTNMSGSTPTGAHNGSGNPLILSRNRASSRIEEQNHAVFDQSNLPRRQLFRQTLFKIQEMLVSLEEKNHVISTANEALQQQLARVEDVWPYLEGEFSDEAKWGSTTHWAYPENRNGKGSQADRTKREGAAAISAAAQACVEHAAARSDARKQAVQAKKNQKTQAHDSDGDDNESRPKEAHKKPQNSKVRKAAESGGVGLGITTAATANGNHPQKRRKVEKEKPAVATNGGAPMERALSAVFGTTAPKTKPTSPRETPVLPAAEPPKKRKALPTSSGQSKKKNGIMAISPSVTTSPVLGIVPESKVPSRPSPAPAAVAPPRPASSRARQNSIQSNSDGAKVKPSPIVVATAAVSTSSATVATTPAVTTTAATTAISTATVPATAPAKPNGVTPQTPEPTQSNATLRRNSESKPVKELSTVAVETPPKEVELPQAAPVAPAPIVSTRRESKAAEDADRKSELLRSTPQNTSTVTTKSGRASKPSTPALASLQETPAPRPRATRNTEPTGNGKRSHKKQSASHAPTSTGSSQGEDPSKIAQGDDDDDAEIDMNEPRYCYCNGVSYGEMVACDAYNCRREWFHLGCVGLKVAPNSKTKWYCDDCKENYKITSKKSNGR